MNPSWPSTRPNPPPPHRPLSECPEAHLSLFGIAAQGAIRWTKTRNGVWRILLAMIHSGSDRRRARRFWIKSAGWLLIIACLAALIFWGVRVIRTGLSLRAHLAQVQAIADKPGLVNPEAACELAYGLRSDIVALEHDIGGLVNLAPLLGGLPKVGGDLRAAPHLLTVAERLSGVGEVTCRSLGPLLGALGDHASQEQKLSFQDACSRRDPGSGDLARGEYGSDTS